MNKNFIQAITVISIFSLQTEMCYATTVLSRTKLPATGTPASVDNPACNPDQHAKNIGQQIMEKGLDAVGKSTSALGLGNDPFNTRRLDQSVCADLCVVVKTGANFTAKGSITPINWQGELPSGLPDTVNPGNFAAITGPSVESTPNGDVVCYTFKNWSHNQDRNVGPQVDY